MLEDRQKRLSQRRSGHFSVATCPGPEAGESECGPFKSHFRDHRCSWGSWGGARGSPGYSPCWLVRARCFREGLLTQTQVVKVWGAGCGAPTLPTSGRSLGVLSSFPASGSSVQGGVWGETVSRRPHLSQPLGVWESLC